MAASGDSGQRFVIGAALAIALALYGVSSLPIRRASPLAGEANLPDQRMGGELTPAAPSSSASPGTSTAPTSSAGAVSDKHVSPPAGPAAGGVSSAASSAPALATSPPDGVPPPRRIGLDSVVGLKCHFSGPDECSGVARGTGVIVNSSGYVLTARHVVDDAWASACYEGRRTTCTLDRCEAMRLGEPRQLPLGAQRTYPVNPYPFFDLDFAPNNWDFTTNVAFMPRLAVLSADEYCALDFAVLALDKWNRDKPGASQPLASSPVLGYRAPAMGDVVLAPGFAYQELGGPSGSLDESRNLSFDQFRLLTTSYVAGEALTGDKRFAATPLTLTLQSDSADITGGRSGSPVFWNGYVAGIVQSVDRMDRSVTRAVAAPAIVEALREGGLLRVIEVAR